MAQPEDPELKTYLRRLGWALATLPAGDRVDIVEETRLHVLERAEQGQAIAQTLAGLGPAETYARGFVDDMEVSGALGSQKWTEVLAAVARRAGRSLSAAGALLTVALMGAVTVVLLMTVAVKIMHPALAGFWVTHDGNFFLGVIDDPSEGREWLGFWLYPIAAAAVLITWQLGRVVLVGALRGFVKPG